MITLPWQCTAYPPQGFTSINTASLALHYSAISIIRTSFIQHLNYQDSLLPQKCTCAHAYRAWPLVFNGRGNCWRKALGMFVGWKMLEMTTKMLYESFKSSVWIKNAILYQGILKDVTFQLSKLFHLSGITAWAPLTKLRCLELFASRVKSVNRLSPRFVASVMEVILFVPDVG